MNKRTIPILPIELESSQTPNQEICVRVPSHMTAVESTTKLPELMFRSVLENSSHASRTPRTSSIFGSATSVEELKEDSVLVYILERALHLHEFINCLTTKCRNKTMDLIDLLWQRNVPAANLFEQESMLNRIELSLNTQHRDNMTRNLSGYDLKVDPIKKTETASSEQRPDSYKNT